MRWSVLSNEDNAVCDVTFESTVRVAVDDMDEQGRARWLGTLCDRRMSPCDEHEICQTCHNGLRGCIGHTGRIVLATPVVVEHYARELLRALSFLSGTSTRWSMKNGEIRENDVFISGRAIAERLRALDDDEWRTAGFRQNPVLLLCSNVVVLPPSARPHCLEHGTWRSDELTTLYSKILRCDRTLRTRQGAVEQQRLEHAMDIFRRASFSSTKENFDTENDGTTHGTRHFLMEAERALTSAVAMVHTALWKRLVGKTGRLRGNLQGTRVNASARGVISCDPYLWVDEVGVPQSVADKLTRPTAVTTASLALFRNAISKTNQIRSIRFGGFSSSPVDVMPHTRHSLASRLSVGDVVDRCLQNGDWVVMNRQPTLHQGSMQAHRVRLHSGVTFTLHQDACTPYNADFDGDEMNMHVPQTVEAQADVEELLAVPRALLGQQGRPMMGIGFDGLSGMAYLTDGSRLISAADMMAFAMRVYGDRDMTIPPPNAKSTAAENMWTGHQAASLLFRAVDMPDWGEEDDPKQGVLIRNHGELLRGQLTKKELGKGHGGLLHALLRERGADVTVRFLSNVASFVLPWMAKQGFSVTFADLTPPLNVRAALRVRVRQLAREAVAGIDRTRIRNADEVMMEKLSEVRDIVGSEAGAALRFGFGNQKNKNRITCMVDSGAKGGSLNVTQIVSALGPQVVGGALPALVNGERSSTAFAKGDHSPNARGFCFTSFLEGLDANDYWWHACASREGIADTGVRVAMVGTLYRRMAKTLENVRVAHDGSARGRCGEILQCMYGEGRVSPAYGWSTWVPLPFPANADDELTEIVRELFCGNHRLRVSLPVNLDAAERASRVGNMSRWGATRQDVQHELRTFCERSLVIYERNGVFLFLFDDKENRWPQWIRTRGHTALMVAVLVRWGNWSLSLSQLRSCLAYVLDQYERACVQTGEAVGAIAAQATGEPATQSTLNTFHLAGTGMGTKVTTGFERQSEITSCSRNDSTPTLVFHGEHQEILNEMRGLTLQDLILTCSIRQWQPYGDDLWEKLFRVAHSPLFSDDENDNTTQKKFMLEYTLRREVLYDTGMTLHAIVTAVTSSSLVNVDLSHVCHSHDRFGQHAIIRIRPPSLNTPGEAQRLNKTILSLGLRGLQQATFDGRFNPETNKTTLLCRKGCMSIPLVDSWRYTGIAHAQTEFSSIWGVAKSLGIDAAQRLIAIELHKVFEAGGGSSVPHAHVSLLAAAMTQTGIPRGVTATGAVAVHPNPLSHGSFERPKSAFITGAIENYTAKEDDVSTGIATGRNIPLGTGDPSVVLLSTFLPSLLPPLATSSSSSSSAEWDLSTTDVAMVPPPQWTQLIPIERPLPAVPVLPRRNDVNDHVIYRPSSPAYRPSSPFLSEEKDEKEKEEKKEKVHHAIDVISTLFF